MQIYFYMFHLFNAAGLINQCFRYLPVPPLMVAKRPVDVQGGQLNIPKIIPFEAVIWIRIDRIRIRIPIMIQQI